MNIQCKNLIGGEWLDGPARAINVCPADTNQHLGTAPVSGTQAAMDAVAAAKAAQPAWEAIPAPQRGAILFKLVGLLEKNSDRLAEALSLEEGKILAEAKGEVAKTARYVEFAAGDCRRMAGMTVPSEIPGTWAMTAWRPLGVIGLITPWNFPVCIPLWKIAPAIAAGNAVVLKPAPETPATAHIIGELCLEAGVPPGVVNIVHGDAEPAKAIIDHPDVAAISFTGSTEVGLAIEARCGALHKPIQCEMGGKNPIIIFPDANPKQAAGYAVKGMNMNRQGQSCSSTSRVLVHQDLHDAVLEEMKMSVTS